MDQVINRFRHLPSTDPPPIKFIWTLWNFVKLELFSNSYIISNYLVRKKKLNSIAQNTTKYQHSCPREQKDTKHLPWQAGDKYSLIFFIICSRAPSHHYAGSLSICGNRFKLRNITLEKETFKHIDLITHITFLPLNHFSNWSK